MGLIWMGLGGLGFVWLWASARRPQELQLFEGAVMGAIEGAFVADQQGQAVALVGQLLERKGQAVNGFHVGEAVLFDVGVDLVGTAEHFVVQEHGFDGADAAQAPAGDGHGLDQLHFDAGLGSELVEIGIEEGLEVFAGFGVENYAAGAGSRIWR